MFGSSQTFTMGFGSTQPTSSSPERPKARTEEKTICLPVTVRLLELTHEACQSTELRFHGSDTEPNMLILVAAVEAVQARNGTCLEFTVNDATGRLKARYFLTDPAQAETLDKIVEGTYVSLYGNFRTAPMPHFSVQGLRPVRSADEVSYHMIEVAHAALKSQRRNGTAMKEPATPAPKVQRQPEDTAMQELVTPPKVQAPQEAPMPKLPEPEPQPALEGATLRDAVLKIVHKEGEATGLTAAQALQHLRSSGVEVKGAEPAVLSVLQALVDEGDAFNTVDDDHFGAI